MKIYAYSLLLVLLLIIPFIYVVRAQTPYLSLIVTEIMPNPIGDDAKYEWIEIQNTTSTTFNLKDWSLNSKSLPDFVINQDEIVVLVRNTEAFPEAFQTNSRLLKADFSLINSGGIVKLENTQNGEYHHFEYGSSQEGKSFELLEGDCGKIELNSTGHTVGEINTSCISPTPTQLQNTPTPTKLAEMSSGKVVIDALTPYPEDGDEWVSLKNIDNITIDLTSWKISDASTKSFTIGIVVIAPGETVKIFPKSVSLNNDGDTVNLIDRNGKIIDSFVYAKATKGQVLTRESVDTNEENVSESGSQIEIASLTEKNKGVVLSSQAITTESNRYFKKPIFYKLNDYVK